MSRIQIQRKLYFVLFIITITIGKSQNMNDTIVLRRIDITITNYESCIDSALELHQFQEVANDEMYLIELDNKPAFYGNEELDSNSLYYFAFFKKKKTNDIKYANALIGYTIHNGIEIIVLIHNFKNEDYIIDGSQRDFVFYDTQHLIDSLGEDAFFSYSMDIDLIQYKVKNNKLQLMNQYINVTH